MSHIASVYCSRVALRLALIGVAAASLAGCAGSERMSDPFGNPFDASQAATDPAPTASINPGAPVTPVQSRPLSAPSPYAGAAAPRAPHVASIPSQPQGCVAGWSAAGGTPVSVAQGENAEILANRYGVPKDALLKANGLSSAAQVQPGTRLVIPVYNATGASKIAQAAPAAPAAPVRPATVAHAEKIKLLKGAVGTSVAKAEKAPAGHVGNLAAEKEKAEAVTRTVAEAPAKKVSTAKAETVAAAPIKTAALTSHDAAKQDNVKQAKAEAAPPAAAKPAHEEEEASAAPDDAKSGGSNPEFRWPARGRIIQAFKPGGNDGINIAVPEGTSVKAAESGVVAYAGNELKGYGNLILIRHPNGFVSAYANNGDIEVKRGETVKRGQVIAKSGQSGNVASPQLHFELRKGATPVDPTLYLAGL